MTPKLPPCVHSLSLLVFAAAVGLYGCQSFVEVHIFDDTPRFEWKRDLPVKSLTVLAAPGCPDVHPAGPAESYQDRVWWQIDGEIKAPVVYGTVPHGAQEVAPPRKLGENCSFVVTVTDANLHAEESSFQLKKASPFPL